MVEQRAPGPRASAQGSASTPGVGDIRRIAVAMSGGVDSAVAAALLVEAGYEVVGVTMHLWPAWLPEPDDPFRACCGVSAIADARAVATHLGIRHYVLNLREAFERAVIDEFVDEYARGRTPHPCLSCNRAIKFALLLRKVRAMGLDGLATGHYARIRYDAAEGRYLLLRGRDAAKDQSDVLFALGQAQLARLRFPVGEYTKAEVRALARARGLPVADKPDSQELCFVPRGSYAELVASRHPVAMRPGPILDGTGRVLGTHRGIARYTVGQRRGLGVSAGRPLYITAIDAARNAVIVGEAADLLAAGVEARQVTWVAGTPPPGPIEVTARVRHGAREVPARAWEDEEGVLHVRFAVPQRAPAPGQAVTLYAGEVVLGGGIIERVEALRPAAVAGASGR
jgi:tRNA-specific 2-thiouridylase